MKSLELNWIRNEDKSLVIPEVIFQELESSAGQYMDPQPYEIYDMDGHPHDMNFGVIIINLNYTEEFESTLAHEWRHHWQLFHGFEYDGIDKYKNNDYDKYIINYFTKSKAEMDALRFEVKNSKTHPYFEELLYDYIKDLL